MLQTLHLDIQLYLTSLPSLKQMICSQINTDRTIFTLPLDPNIFSLVPFAWLNMSRWLLLAERITCFLTSMALPKFHFDMPLLLLSSNLPSFLYRSSVQYPRAVAVDTVNKIYGCHLQISSVTLWMNTCIRVQKDCHFQMVG